ncbi:MAG: TetR/AcrR family transcriptional regulator [Cyclobacteriaceae bacterium]
MSEQAESTKYIQIKNTARKLFWKHGILRVSVEEICREAGARKMTFYRMFDNKIEVAKTVLNEVMESSLKEFHAIMEQDIPFPEKIRRTIQLELKGSQDISEELLRDIYKNEEPELIAFMAEKRKQGVGEVYQSLAKAQSQGCLRKDIKLEFVIYFMNKINDMVTDEELLAMYHNPQELIMELTNFFFYGILPPTDSE